MAAIPAVAEPTKPPPTAASAAPQRPAARTAPQVDHGRVAAGGAAIIAPRRGARFATNTVRITLRAGDESADVVAQLNGVEIGRHFGRTGDGRRVFEASAGTGLRPGANTLTVRVHRGTTTQKASVRFHVVALRGLVGAGLDRRLPVGNLATMTGTMTGANARGPLSAHRWEVVSAPAASRYARGAPTRAITSGAAIPTASVRAALPVSGSAAAPTASFRPDAPGPYVLQLRTTGVGRSTATDRVSVTAVPADPVVAVDTRYRSSSGVPGIRVGTTAYPAPPVGLRNGQPIWSIRSAGVYSVMALWQLVAVDRATLTVLTDSAGRPWNRTYGICDAQGANPYPCRLIGGTTQRVSLTDDLAALPAVSTLVIGASQVFRDPTPSTTWGPPDQSAFARTNLAGIGFPDSPDVTTGVGPGQAAVIGTVGLSPDEADYVADPDALAGMSGYLVSDQNDLFGFVPSTRLPFDTAADLTCAAGSCALEQTFGTTVARASIADGAAGYLVSVVGAYDGSLQGVATFDTSNDSDGAHAAAMASFIGDAADDDLVSITAVKTAGSPAIVDPRAPVAAWAQLAAAVASVGGTRDTFNRSVSTSDSAYTLIGWGGATAGSGVQSTRSPARLRGDLVPNRKSLLRPTNAKGTTAPADRMAQLVVRTPVTAWPLDGQPGPRAALRAIGVATRILGDDPRATYWSEDLGNSDTLAAAKSLVAHFDCSKPGAYGGQAYTAADCTLAKTQLTTELTWVGQVWSYTQTLAQPAGTGATSDVWDDAQDLYTQLQQDLDNLQQDAETTLDWFDLVANILGLISLLDGVEEFEEAAEAAAALSAMTFLAADFADGNYRGGSGGDELPVQADQIANEIKQQALQAENGWRQIRTMILADPTKLQEVGTYAFCNATGDGCGSDGEYAEYGLTADQQAMNSSLARRSIERLLNKQLVPLAYPVWHTGPSGFTDPARFYSCGVDEDNPFTDNPPEQAYALELRSIDPASPGVTPVDDRNGNQWAFYLMVSRSGLTYGFPDSSPTMDHMFDPPYPGSGTAPDGYGLGLRAVDFLPTSPSVFDIPGVEDCGWTE